LPPASADFLLGFFLSLEDGSNMFLRMIRLSANYDVYDVTRQETFFRRDYFEM
jgi:hypothetical protein